MSPRHDLTWHDSQRDLPCHGPYDRGFTGSPWPGAGWLDWRRVRGESQPWGTPGVSPASFDQDLPQKKASPRFFNRACGLCRRPVGRWGVAGGIRRASGCRM